MSCGVDCRHGLDLALLWLWYRLAASAPIPPPAWETPYAICAALKSKKKPLKLGQGYKWGFTWTLQGNRKEFNTFI